MLLSERKGKGIQKIAESCQVNKFASEIFAHLEILLFWFLEGEKREAQLYRPLSLRE